MSQPNAQLVSDLVTCPRCQLRFAASATPFPDNGPAASSNPGTVTVLPSDPGPVTPTSPTPPSLPARIARFEITRYLGEGSFGRVYEALDPLLKRTVALKVAKPEQLTGQRRIERFQREARAVANLLHPHIVAVFDSGQDGPHHYIASVFVPGRSLAAVLEELPQGKTLPLPEAVQIVRKLAEALGYAHKQGVIHRDVKPSNVMVRDDGEPMLMDFGLAARLDETEKLSVVGQFMGTPEYTAPEQWRGEGQAASDQYSLGCLLFELLTGERPFAGSSSEHYLMLHTQQPAPSPRKTRPDLPRDLETICLKCLEKEPERRYADCQALADDLRRWLEGEPVTARRPGVGERLVRWTRRNPALAGMLAALVVVILGSMTGLTALYVNAEQQRNLADRHRKMAEHEKEGARAISKFYEDHVLAAPRPKGWEGGRGTDVTLREALDKAAPKIDEALAGQPEMEANVRYTLGSTYWYLGQFEAAYPHLDKAYAIRLERFGPDHPDTLTSLDSVAMEHWKQDKLSEAVALERQALAKRRVVLGPEHQDTLWSQINLGLFLAEEADGGWWEADPEQFDEAEALIRQAIESSKRTLGADHHHTLYAQMGLYFILESREKYEDALALARQTLEGRRRAMGPEHPDTLRSLADMCWFLDDVGKREEAEAQCRQALAARRRILGDAHLETFRSLNQLAYILTSRKKMADAEDLYRKTLKDCQRLRGPDEPETLNCLTKLGKFLMRQGKLVDAEQLLRQAVEASRGKLGAEHGQTLFRNNLLAKVLAKQGKTKEAEELYRQTLDALRRVRGIEHSNTLTVQTDLAAFLRTQGKKADAEALYRDVVAVCLRARGPDHKRTLSAQQNLAAVLKDQGKLTEAEDLYRSLWETRQRVKGPEHAETIASLETLADFLQEHKRKEQAEQLYHLLLAAQRKVSPAGHPDIASRLAVLGSILSDAGRTAEAEPLLRECVTIREKKLPAGHWQTANARSLLGGCLVRRKKFAEAEPHLLAGCEGLSKAKDAPARRVADALDRVIELYEKWGKPEKAEEWRKKRPAAAKSTATVRP